MLWDKRRRENLLGLFVELCLKPIPKASLYSNNNLKPKKLRRCPLILEPIGPRERAPLLCLGLQVNTSI